MNFVKRFRILILASAIVALPLFSVAYAAWFPFSLQAGPETVAIFQGDCTTPATSFTLGDTVCAKLTNAPTGFRATQVLRRLAIVGPDGFIRAKTDVPGTDSSDELTFTIPATETSLVGGEALDNRGSWQGASFSGSDGSAKVKTAFTVTSNIAVAQLSLQSVVSDAEISAGEQVSFVLYLQNSGPNAAADVEVTTADPSFTTFVSAASSDPNLECTNDTGSTTCTIASLAAQGAAKIALTYAVGAGTPVKTEIVLEASVTTTTAQRSTRGNSTKAATVVATPAVPGSCELTCPANVIATADTTNASVFGAFVKFGAAGVNGDCGAVTNSPASGSFFAVGTHNITSSAEGGGSCSFTVKVLGTPAPTISCPANKTATAPEGTEEATVVVGTPTFNASGGGTVVGVRSDGTPAIFDEDGVLVTPAIIVPLTDPYPVGITGIDWTVTDADGRTATCRQTVTVNPAGCGVNDTTNPTITAPDDVTIGTGTGNTGCSISLDDELGQAEANDDSNCPVTVTVTGIPTGNNFAPGTYTLTYTATDAAGNTASDTQTVTVTDTTAPVIQAPDDATYTCPSEVPAASASQATRGEVFDEDGVLLPPGPPFDNCGVPVVTVTETNNGGAGSATSPRIITRTFRATDSAGNFSEDVQVITVADGTAPTLNVPADITVNLPANSTATSMAVTFTPTATDNCSGAVTIVSTPASGSTFNVGTTLVNVTATDAAGNQTTGSFNVTVLYNFAGFFSPVDNLPTLNLVNAGKAIPVKFSLSGNKGLSIFAAGYPVSVGINCDGSSEAEVEETLTAGSSSLSYSSTSDQYNYVWKTESSWAGTCRQLVVKLNDGTEHTANFKFR
jgi:hypothetical protein